MRLQTPLGFSFIGVLVFKRPVRGGNPGADQREAECGLPGLPFKQCFLRLFWALLRCQRSGFAAAETVLVTIQPTQ